MRQGGIAVMVTLGILVCLTYTVAALWPPASGQVHTTVEVCPAFDLKVGAVPPTPLIEDYYEDKTFVCPRRGDE